MKGWREEYKELWEEELRVGGRSRGAWREKCEGLDGEV